DEPEMIEQMLDMFTDGAIAVVEAIADLSFHLYYLGDDLGTNLGPIISHKHIKKLWAPRYERIVRAMQATGHPIINHCCGDQSSVLPYLAEWGVQATHPIQPGPNDIAKIHAQYGQQLALIGNINVAGILSHGTPAEVYRATAENIERFGDGYVACSSHSIIDSVPPENYLAMVRAAHELG
ncbi:MAG: uroporphyrinogen decarboxylase family protein, partial [Planctomycetota bacterium]